MVICHCFICITSTKWSVIIVQRTVALYKNNYAHSRFIKQAGYMCEFYLCLCTQCICFLILRNFHLHQPCNIALHSLQMIHVGNFKVYCSLYVLANTISLGQLEHFLLAGLAQWQFKLFYLKLSEAFLQVQDSFISFQEWNPRVLHRYATFKTV